MIEIKPSSPVYVLVYRDGEDVIMRRKCGRIQVISDADRLYEDMPPTKVEVCELTEDIGEGNLAIVELRSIAGFTLRLDQIGVGQVEVKANEAPDDVFRIIFTQFETANPWFPSAS